MMRTSQAQPLCADTSELWQMLQAYTMQTAVATIDA